MGYIGKVYQNGLGILRLSPGFIHRVPASNHRILIGWHVSARLSLFHGYAWPSFFILPSQSLTLTSQPWSLSDTIIGKRIGTSPQFQSKTRDSIMHSMPTLRSLRSLSYSCGLSVIKKKNCELIDVEFMHVAKWTKKMVHLCKSLTLLDASKEIKLMGLYPIALIVWCLLLLWALCESLYIKRSTVCIWTDMLSFFMQSAMLQGTKCIWNSILAHNSKSYSSVAAMNGLH